jgi:hypothetical protein
LLLERLYTEIGKPFSAMLRARFWPITARPTRPILESEAEAIAGREKQLDFL